MDIEKITELAEKDVFTKRLNKALSNIENDNGELFKQILLEEIKFQKIYNKELKINEEKVTNMDLFETLSAIKLLGYEIKIQYNE